MNKKQLTARTMREDEQKAIKLYKQRKHHQHEVDEVIDELIDDEMDEDLIEYCRKYLK